EIEESIFAFTLAPDQQIGRVAKGGSNGAKGELIQPQNGDHGSVLVSIGEKNWKLDVISNMGKEVPLDGSPFTLKIQDYWPDFRITNGKPGSVRDHPNTPAVVVTLRGKAIPVAAASDQHGTTPSGAP